SAAHQLGAVHALGYYWRHPDDPLERVLEHHPAAACRAAALRPLLPRLVARGDQPACALVFDNLRLETRADRHAALAALRAFDSASCREWLATRLKEQSLDSERKLLLLDLFEDDASPLVRAALEKRLGDPIDAVRLRALELLARLGDADLVHRLEKIARYGDEAFVVRAIGVLAGGREGDRGFIEQLYGFTRDQSALVRLGAVRALAKVPTQDALTLLHRLLDDRDRRVQLAALAAVGEKRQLRSLPRLIELLGHSDGITSDEAARWLRLFTGLDHGLSAARWGAWFEREGLAFQMPTREEGERLEAERLARRNELGELRTASFYGLHIDSRRVCFVIDLSGSMADPATGRGSASGARTRLAVAKEELRNALRQLLDGVRFNLVAFASGARSFAPALVELSASTRTDALLEVEGWISGGGTALYEGVMTGLADPEVDTLYLLTDGEPSEGEVTAPEEIHRRVVEVCARRGVKIHAVAIGRASSLLKALARDTGGQYVELL
ncbi:MAG: HEAT repeat domain-containing protein, partial [Planctomycetes bacterium]|nr:HEAT repeat domain-containing protein [Planctomycetota bacterium]